MLICARPIMKLEAKISLKRVEASHPADVLGRHVAGDELGDRDVEPLQHQERAQGDKEAVQLGPDQQPTVQCADREREEQREDNAHPKAAGDLRGEHRAGEGGGRHRNARGEVELAADHQQRDADRWNADGGGLVEDGSEGRKLAKRRGYRPKEDEDEDRAAQRADFRPLQGALPERLSLVLASRLRQRRILARRRHGFLPSDPAGRSAHASSGGQFSFQGQPAAQRVPILANFATAAALSLVTKNGPVSTGSPPPTVSPFVTLSQIMSTAS